MKSLLKRCRRALKELTKPLDLSLYCNPSFSQGGEDRVLFSIFEGVERGFYVDVGAMHPFRYSNTALFDLSGWSGICVEPNPELSKMLSKSRPRCCVSNVAVGIKDSNIPFYTWEGRPALSTTDENFAIEQQKRFNLAAPRKSIVPSMPLGDILKGFNAPESFQLLDIDVEGADFAVLVSNDWDKYRPEVVCIETDTDGQRINDFLNSKGYELAAKLHLNSIYVRSQPKIKS